MQDEALKRLTPLQHRLFLAIKASPKGSLGAPELRQDIALPNGQVWTARSDGCTDEIVALREAGLIFVDHTEKRGGPPTKMYAVTPPEDIAKQARKFKGEKRPPKRDMGLGGLSQRIADYRRQEKEAGASARVMWIERRRRIVELGQNLRRTEPMAFWKAVDDDELEMVYEEVADLAVWVDRMMAAIDTQRGNRQLREKIANLRKANGRTLEEADTARAIADKLEARLMSDGGA